MKPSLTLLLDLGNSAAGYGLAKNGSIFKVGSTSHDDIPFFVKKCCLSGDDSLITVVISSVVPHLTRLILNKIKHNSRVSIAILGKNLPIPVKSSYEPKQLGVDRLLNAYGCLKLHGKGPFLVLDYGTALTVDYISASGRFEGGLIIPGPETALKSLLGNAALLPNTLTFPKQSKGLTAQNTKDAILSGILEAYGAMTDGLVLKYRKRFGKKLRVIATGGLSSMIGSVSSSLDHIDPELSVKAMLHLHQNRAS